jgi:glycosyltransferase involved in cell wall biosynthesis
VTPRPRILIPVYEQLDGPMSALGTRRLEIGCAMARHCAVTFASTAATKASSIRAIPIEPIGTTRQFRRLLDNHDFLYTLSIFPRHAFHIARSGIKVILDLYAPVAFECLEAYPEMPARLLDQIHRQKTWWTAQQMRMADVLVVTNSRQADFWIGVANQLELLNAHRIRTNPALDDFIIEMPLAVPPGSPERAGTPLRDRLNLAPDDFLFLWTSKFLAWQDPAVLLRSMNLLRERDSKIKLVFLGVGEPAPEGKASWLDASALRTREARQLANELGLTGKTVFFVNERINYQDLGSHYRDCNAAVAAYPDSLETRMCLATRLTDYIWAELPTAITGGPLQKQFIEGQGIGYCGPPGQEGALAANMQQIKREVTEGGWDLQAFAAAKQRYSLDSLTMPVLEWCRRAGQRPRTPRSGIREALAAVRFVAMNLAFHARMRLEGVAEPGLGATRTAP